MREKLINTIASFWDRIWSISDVIVNIAWFFLQVLWFIRFWFRSIISWIWWLITRVFDSWVFLNVNRALLNLSHYIWAVPTLFIFAMLFIIIVRTIIHFVLHIWVFSNRFKSKRVDIDDVDLPYVDDETYPRLPSK